MPNQVGISNGKGSSVRSRPWRYANGTNKVQNKNHAVVILGFDPLGDKPIQMDFVGYNKPESVTEYMGKINDWASNDVKSNKGQNEIWWVYVKVMNTQTMKPFGKIMKYHDNSADAKIWAEKIEATIKGNPMATLTELYRGQGPWSELLVPQAAAAAGAKPERKVRKVGAAAAAAAPVPGDKPVRKIRKPKAAVAA